MSLFIQDAVAQTSQAAGANPSIFQSLMPFILIFFVFYFLMIRPQKKRIQEEQNFISALAKGQEIYTKSGIFGTISGLTDKVVTLEIAEGIKIKVLKSQIGGLANKLFESKNKKKK